MDWEKIRRMLESILNAPLQLVKLSVEEWSRRSKKAIRSAENVKSDQSVSSRSVALDGRISFMLETVDGQVLAIETEEVLLTLSEKQLIELMLEAYRGKDMKTSKSVLTATDEQKKAYLIKEWLHQQMELNHQDADLPDSLSSQLSLFSNKIPLLLYGDFSDTREVRYQDLKKLLESFFESEIILIPLMEKEWVILAMESLLTASAGETKGEEQEESIEESLASICSGLYEMLANEWVGECHLSIHYPMQPTKSLLRSVLQMRETIMLGRTYYVGSNIHLPWMMHLEKLLNGVSDSEKHVFIGQIFKRLDPILDAETQSTLEHFFDLDCNVSETAKKLYIHRNTLLYRLDKIKMETGFDVRNFSDAVLVKVALLLYKVTKRK